MIRSLVNGKQADQVSILDRGLQFGDGLFETLAVAQGRPCLWDHHIQRLQSGCGRLNIPVPDSKLLRREAEQLIEDRQQAVLKITITRGISARGYQPAEKTLPTRVLSLSPWKTHSPDGVVVAISSRRLSHNPDLAGIKHLNRLEQVLARMDCAEAVQDALMLDRQGNVVEAIASNLFLQRGQKLLTPALNNCGVEGVVRRIILEVAGNEGVEIATGNFSLDEVLQADALYLTNSLNGIRQVIEVSGYDWRPREAVHPLLARAATGIFN